MGADPNQLIKALTEAASYPGPSVVIAYAPCISHGIKAGMANVQAEMKRAVDAGLWLLYRYNPLDTESPLKIDSKEPSLPYREFLMGQTRYSSLIMKYPDIAEKLFAEGEKQAKEKYCFFIRQAAALNRVERENAEV